MVSFLAEVKYLESDDFDQTIRVHIARLETLSVRIVARCGLLHSNPTIFHYDFDILIADFGRDLTRIQAACMQREDATFRLLFATGLYSRQAFIRDTTVCVR